MVTCQIIRARRNNAKRKTKAHPRKISEVDAAWRALCQWSVACVAVVSACFNRPVRPEKINLHASRFPSLVRQMSHAVVKRDIWWQDGDLCSCRCTGQDCTRAKSSSVQSWRSSGK
ncbi:hypothetical protein HII31_02270 [Pseudocercospora fuligena]|uniref:Uncharacterized protein n=1 Tax=Pseudocercospora fuligena TaxID=685502 RepID=A0A8H6VNA7_9PEZI|nr:hypothetical protein HII31_02270 [Pseudocercospora fuligena]